MSSTSDPRIPPLTEPELTPEQRELFGGIPGPASDAGAAHIFTTLVRHPGLFRRWLPFAGKLLVGRLPARDRELLILRTAVNCGSSYEWAHHVRIGLASGLTLPEIERVKERPTDWDGSDAVLLRAADELHESSTISDATWDSLAERYDEMQLIEVPMVVGHYHLVAYTLNALGVPLEPGADSTPSLEF
ncbi:MAG TPA: carboxymuconolactone decarboxylase family protein [Acidimicrobiales bacterium]|nr:carboxymuconolactone decarboxylase family protein [Acidimicrobiales bacterium]